MAESGDWLVPQYNGQPFFDKPPLFHVLQGTAMRWFGESEFVIRLVPALAAALLIVWTAWVGSRLASPNDGVVAALLLAVSPGTFALARYAILDSLFTAFEFGGVAVLAVAAVGAAPQRVEYAGYALLALATLTKGPFAIALAGLSGLVAVVLVPRVGRQLAALHWGRGLILVAVSAGPWFFYMLNRYGRAFVDGYVLDENVRLYARHRFGSQPGPLFYFQILAAALMPWTGVLLGRFLDDMRAIRRRESLDAFEVLLWIWAGVVIGFFSVSKFKLDHYVYPAAPALALLCARAWSDAGGRPGDRQFLATRVGLQLVGPSLIAIGLYLMVFITPFQLPTTASVVTVSVILIGVVVAVMLNINSRASKTVPLLATTAILVVYVGAVELVIPALEQRKVVPTIARWVATHAAPSDRIAIYRLNRWSSVFRFYVNRPTTALEDASAAEHFFAGPGRFYCTMLERPYAEFVSAGAPLAVMYSREGLWVTSGRALRRKGPLVRFVVVGRGRRTDRRTSDNVRVP